jgi:hypothetical protein
VAPYGTDSPFEAYRMARAMHLDAATIAEIQCPVLLTDPDDEQFWPGQSRQLFDALPGPKELVHFTREEGANWHCEAAAQALRDEPHLQLARGHVRACGELTTASVDPATVDPLGAAETATQIGERYRGGRVRVAPRRSFAIRP